MPKTSIVLLRNDLRLDDNPALQAAAETGQPVQCVYLYENGLEGIREPGAASKWWLDKSLRKLDDALSDRGGRLFLKKCDGVRPAELVRELVDTFDADSVFWNRRYGPRQRELDQELKTALKDDDITAESFNGALLCEPWDVKTTSDGYYKVFTPFWKALREAFHLTEIKSAPDCDYRSETGDDIDDWAFHPTEPDWSDGIAEHWTPGTEGAKARLKAFLDDALKGYSDNRDRPDYQGTSGLSPHLSFGEISPRQIWAATQSRMSETSSLESDGWAFLREVGWRDFSYCLLYQAENLAEKNWNDRFDAFPWDDNQSALKAWQQGKTGYPMVDAGMRELWETGWMHNRVRMIVGSFLVKHLRIHWREGEDWFWDTLVDADVANNPASWQWIAGSGADAAPYFRIFNPMTQGEKFDPKGDYVRKWCPELKKLSDKKLHQPWTASKAELSDAGITLGKTYPKPIVEHKAAREAALDAYDKTK